MTPKDSTVVTFSQVYNDVKGALSGMADALKVGAEHVYQVLVMQQVVNSIGLIFVYACGIVACFLLYKLSLKASLKAAEDSDYEGAVIASYGAFFVVLILTSIGLYIDFKTIVTGFINPEYGAIMEIKSFIK